MSDTRRPPAGLAPRPRYDRVVLCCPAAVTGGPEAMHQLSDAIIAHGGEALMAYYGEACGAAVTDAGVTCTYQRPPSSPAYRSYRSAIAREIPLTPRSLVVFPEVELGSALAPRPFQKAVWWLSVDNATLRMPALAYPSRLRELIARPDVIHFYQSDYARDFLARAGASLAYPLGDYINPEFLDRKAALVKDSAIAYFPRKGKARAEAFFARHPDLQRRPIDNMSREEVRAALSASPVYVDFGDHPGKDRVPREAALCGNAVFLHERGAAAFHLDHPLDRFFIFTTQDILDGTLHARVREVLADPEQGFARQSTYRSRIAFEREEFAWQVKTWFFDAGLARCEPSMAGPNPGGRLAAQSPST